MCVYVGWYLGGDWLLAATMKFVTKKGLKSIVPLRLKGKSATRFCLFPKVKAEYGPGNSPVYLNVYDLTPMNGYAYWAGFGIFHSGVEGMLLHLCVSLTSDCLLY